MGLTGFEQAFVFGLVISVWVGIVLFGGVRRIVTWTDKLSPFMCLLYIMACVVVLGANYANLGPALVTIVHEAFVRLAQQRGVVCRSRGEFFGWMSMLMRRILVDHARGRNAAKRGEGAVLLRLDELQAGSVHLADGDSGRWLDILQLDQALQRLAELDERQGKVVELRFVGGLSVEQTAEALQVSVTTVKREGSTARAWLLRELGRRTERAA